MVAGNNLKGKSMNKKKHYVIYQVTNLLNGKIYIGKHETFDINDDYMGSGKLVKRAIEKYGVENFKKEILFDFETKEEMNAKEKELVNESFVAREDTYNLTLGGYGSWKHCQGSAHNNLHNHRRTGFLRLIDAGIKFNIERLAKMTEEEKNAMYMNISNGVRRHYKEFGSHWQGRKHSQESKEKISKARKGTGCGCLNNNFGKHWYTNPQTGESHPFKEEDVPEGWIKGKTQINSEQAKINLLNGNKKRIGYHWYRNLEGTKTIQCSDDNAPEGWIRGRIHK